MSERAGQRGIVEKTVKETFKKTGPGKTWLTEQPRKQYVVDINVIETESLLYLNELYTETIISNSIIFFIYYFYWLSLFSVEICSVF